MGAVRAKNGHPEPFKLTYVEIGNEEWFDKSGSYDQRYAQFSTAIKAKDDYLASSGLVRKLLKRDGLCSKACPEESWQQVRFHGSSVEAVVELRDIAP